MIPFVRCPSCQTEIGAKCLIYTDIRAARLTAYYAKAGAPLPANAAFDPVLPEKGLMDGVLDKLNLKGCCRVRVITAIAHSDVY